MNPAVQNWIQTGIIVMVLGLTVVHFDRRFDDVHRRFDDFKDLLRAEAQRLEDRLERLEHPVTPP